MTSASAINVLRRAISRAGTALRSVNPSLLPHPPPYFEKTGVDVCCKGPNGETDGNAVVLCQSLPGNMRQYVARWVSIAEVTGRTCVDSISCPYSWYIHPERQVLEVTLGLAVSIILMRRVLALNHSKPTKQVVEPPLLMKLVTSVVVALHIGYKMGKWHYMTWPCNLSWIAYWIICYVPVSPRARQIFYQLMIPFLAFPILALSYSPERIYMLRWMEEPFYYIHHILLVVFAMYSLRSGRTSMLPAGGTSVLSSLMHQWMMAFGVFGVYMFGMVPLSIYCGLNLNYVMSPPQNHRWLSGPWYRIILLGYFAIKFLIIQLIVLVFEMYRERRVQSPRTKRKGE